MTEVTFGLGRSGLSQSRVLKTARHSVEMKLDGRVKGEARGAIRTPGPPLRKKRARLGHPLYWWVREIKSLGARQGRLQ